MKTRSALLGWLAGLCLSAAIVTPGQAQLKLPWENEKKDPPKVKTAPAPVDVTTPKDAPANIPNAPAVAKPTEPTPTVSTPANSTYGEVVERLFSLIAKNDVGSAFDLTSQDYRSDVSKASFGAFVRFWGILGKHARREMREVFFRKDVATLRARLTTSGTDGLSVDLHLVREDGQWRIDSIVILADEEGASYPQGRTPAIAEVLSGFGKVSQDSGGGREVLSWAEVVSREITPEELKPLSSDRLKMLRNEVFARHGYEFKQPDLARYFRKQPWYFSTTNDQGSIDMALSVLEKENLKLIAAEEQQRGTP